MLVSRALAAVFVAGDFDVDSLVDRGARLLGQRWRWLRPLAQRVVEEFSRQVRPRRDELARFISTDRGYLRAWEKYELEVVDPLATRPWMSPAGVARHWAVPAIHTAGNLADSLGISLRELDWLADRNGLASRHGAGRLSHYHHRLLTKRFGKMRLIESPKPRLKQVQRFILREILDRIPPHAAAHGFCRGRSIRTFAEPHAGQQAVLKIDLEDFFPSISAARIQALFRTAGFPDEVADLLAGLCTTTAPIATWEHEHQVRADPQFRRIPWLYARRHLPQGAPTSPALANLCAYRLDCRLAALAESAEASYTRYADDLAFSGQRPFQRVAQRFHLHVCAVVLDESFRVHHRKTRLMRQGVCQRIAGLVVNDRVNIPRRDFDRLKATLTNCVRFGPNSQNKIESGDFQRHLDGRVSFVEAIHPARGQRLRQLFDQIDWSGSHRHCSDSPE